MKYAAMVAALLGFVGQASAQSGQLSGSDKSYLTKDRRGAAYELESAKLASSKSSREDVKSYARKLVQDHETYNAALEKLGKQEGVTLPTDLDAADKAHMANLEKLSGKAFDALYIREAIRINAEDKKDAEKEKSETKNADVKNFIAKFTDVDAEHEKLAKALERSND